MILFKAIEFALLLSAFAFILWIADTATEVFASQPIATAYNQIGRI